MSWYKKSQFTEENTSSVQVPTINVQPYEPIVQQVVEEIKEQNPSFFVGINQINVDPGHSQFGSVSSTNPADININFNRIKDDFRHQMGVPFNPYNAYHLQIFKDSIKRVIVHEKAHVSDAAQAQQGSENPLSGEELFPGGENVAEQEEKKYFNISERLEKKSVSKKSPAKKKSKINRKIKLKEKSTFDYKNQNVKDLSFGDIQRYSFDSYDIKVVFSKTNKRYTVSLVIVHVYLGNVVLNLFWSFDLNEFDNAKFLFNKVVEVTKKVIRHFVENEMPTSTFSSFLSKRLQSLKNKEMVRTNIPFINYSYDLEVEGDWRSSIYGNRYQQVVDPEQSFSQAKDKSPYDSKNYNKGRF